MRTTDRRFRPLSKATGGGIIWLEDGAPDLRRVKPERASAGRDWLGLLNNQNYTVKSVREVPLTARIYSLAPRAWYIAYGVARRGPLTQQVRTLRVVSICYYLNGAEISGLGTIWACLFGLQKTET